MCVQCDLFDVSTEEKRGREERKRGSTDEMQSSSQFFTLLATSMVDT